MRIRTGHSFRVAYGHLHEVASRLQDIGWDRQPISDTGNTYAYTSWSKLVPDPIYGVELAVVPQAGLRGNKRIADWWSFFAIKDLEPLHDLIGLATTGMCSGGKTRAELEYKEAANAKNLIKIAGSWCLFQKGMKPTNKDLYISLSPSTPLGLYKIAKKAGYNFVAMSDNVYPTQNDRETYRLALGAKLEGQDFQTRASTQTYPQHILCDDEWNEALHWVPAVDRRKAITNRNRIMDRCVAKIDKAELYKPRKNATLHDMCVSGAQEKDIDLTDRRYLLRLKRELELIASKQFEDYFYIIADIIGWAKRNNIIVGPARGSSCGSLVCYLLDITAVDPLKYDLIFERFIDINRSDLPDIDIDFSDTKRELVFAYVEEKYGAEHVARLGTVGTFQPRSALQAAGPALNIPRWQLDKVLDGVIVRSSGDSRALQQLEDTLNDTEAGRKLKDEYPAIAVAAKLEGHPTNASQHAAGVVITSQPIKKYVAIDHRNNNTIAMCDKYDAEHLNLLKIDMLGLTQLSIFERTIELLGETPSSAWLDKIPLDDPAAFDVINRQHFSGIFQFNGSALQSLAKAIVADNLEDIVSITALARPGPMASGGAQRWVFRRTGREPISYPHPLFEPYLNKTFGIVCYQEQVMEIGRNIGDLSWEDVTAIRKAMSKSLGKEFFDQYGDRWKKAARKKGIPEATLTNVWDDLCAYGSWAFNRSHAVAYGLVSYYCCWFKAHHSLEFAAATLDAERNYIRQIGILRELRGEGIDYIPVDITQSLATQWSIKDNKTLLGPLMLIEGVAEVYANRIVQARDRGEDLSRILPALDKKIQNARTKIDTLSPIADRVELIANGDLENINIISTPTPIIDIQDGKMGRDRSIVILGVPKRIVPRDMNEPVKVAGRGGRLHPGPSAYLNLFLRDDTDEILCWIGPDVFEKIGRPIIEVGGAGKVIYAIKGYWPSNANMRMLSVERVMKIGDMEDNLGSSAKRGVIRTSGEDSNIQ